MRERGTLGGLTAYVWVLVLVEHLPLLVHDAVAREDVLEPVCPVHFVHERIIDSVAPPVKTCVNG